MKKRRKRGGRPSLTITKPILKKLEKLGASGVPQIWAAMALGISEDTFMRRRLDNPSFEAAWKRGKARQAMKVVEAAPKIMAGLIKNALTPTDSAPGGNVAAQLGYLEKVVRRPHAENTGQVSIEEELGSTVGLPSHEDAGPIEIQEVRVRRIRRIPGSGRIEDEE